MIVKESVGVVQIPVSRTDGADGKVVLNWEARNQTAVYGKDYDTKKGTIVFEHGELSKTIDIGIIDDQVGVVEKLFRGMSRFVSVTSSTIKVEVGVGKS